MALNSVTLMELLRPWRGAGITHLLAIPEPGDPTPDELEALLQPPASSAVGAALSPKSEAPGTPLQAGSHSSLGTGASSDPLPGTGAPQGNAPASTHSSQASHGEGRSIPSHLLPPQHGSLGQQPTAQGNYFTRPGQATTAQNPTGQTTAGQNQTGQNSTGQATAGQNSTVQTSAMVVPPVAALPAPNIEVHTWPESWQELWKRTHPASIVWSYPALSQDLAGQGSPERSQLMRSLIGSLSLPKGSSAFWPLTAHQDSGACAMPAAYAGAIARLAPQVVVFMGASALPLSGLALTLSFPFTQQILGGRLFVLLPETEYLIADAAAKARAAAFLRAQFASIPSLFFTKG